MLRRKYLPCLVLLLAGLIVLPGASADDRRFGNTRSRDYDRSYYGPRHPQVLPTRPFFVQPYPRNFDRHGHVERGGRHGYKHGYREGYGDGYSERHAHKRNRHGRHDRDRTFDGPRTRDYGRGDAYHARPYDNHYYRQPNYYAPRPGISLYYNSH